MEECGPEAQAGCVRARPHVLYRLEGVPCWLRGVISRGMCCRSVNLIREFLCDTL